MSYSVSFDKKGCLLYVPDGLDPEKTFDCGQCFRFDKSQNGFFGIAGGKTLSVKLRNDSGLFLEGVTEEDFEIVWKDFFDLERDYSLAQKEIIEASGASKDHLKLCIEKGNGIRILNQDPWETTLSFVISQNNNIQRIKKLIRSLCREAGKDLGGDCYSFPEPEAVLELGEERLRELSFGFRAPYLINCAQAFHSGSLDASAIKEADYHKAKEMLCTVKGIGEKVANCALLFGYSKREAFPVDVWMRKVIDTRLNRTVPDFGLNAGLAQQYMFYYERYLAQ